MATAVIEERVCGGGDVVEVVQNITTVAELPKLKRRVTSCTVSRSPPPATAACWSRRFTRWLLILMFITARLWDLKHKLARGQLSQLSIYRNLLTGPRSTRRPARSPTRGRPSRRCSVLPPSGPSWRRGQGRLRGTGEDRVSSKATDILFFQEFKKAGIHLTNTTSKVSWPVFWEEGVPEGLPGRARCDPDEPAARTVRRDTGAECPSVFPGPRSSRKNGAEQPGGSSTRDGTT